MTDTSILTSTKAALGLAEDYTAFDAEVIMHINSVLATFNQLGLGPVGGHAIEDEGDTWEDFLGPNVLLYNGARSLLFLQVKMLFDPPSIGYVLNAMERMIDQATWRVVVARDEVVNPYVVPVVVVCEDPIDP